MGLNGYILAAVAAVMLVMGVIITFLWSENGQLQTDLATERANVQTAKDALNDQKIENVKLRKDFEAQGRRLTDLDDQVKEWGDLYAEKERELNAWRGRLEAETLKRPEVVGRAARRAINRSLLDAEQATGSDPNGRAAAGDPPAASGEGAGAGRDRAGGDDAGDGGAEDREGEVRR